jgi:hypothetical protein
MMRRGCLELNAESHDASSDRDQVQLITSLSLNEHAENILTLRRSLDSFRQSSWSAAVTLLPVRKQLAGI